MKFISLFSGVGGFDLALTRLGHKCVYANDIDKFCKITYDKNFETKLDLRSISTVKSEEIPDAELLVGGFPCQAFSIAGKRRGFDDTRGTLFFEIARILRDKRPRYFILENVKGLLSHDSGKTFQTILRVLTEIGYDCQWEVLNSKNFGVPQNRERVFIVGHLRGASRPKVFPIRQNTSSNEIKIIGSTKGEENNRQGHRDLVYADDGIVGALKATDYKQPIQIIQLNQPNHSNDRVYGEKGISPTLNTMQGGRRQPKIIQKQGNNVNDERYVKKEMVGAIKSQNQSNPRSGGTSLVYDDVKIRRLTPLECQRLQGFPDDFYDSIKMSDTQKYKQMGNAVTVNVVYEIAKRLL